MNLTVMARIRRITANTISVLIMLNLVIPMGLIGAQAPLEEISGSFEVEAGEFCAFPVLGEFSGKMGTIELPGGGTLFTFPGLSVTLTNLANEENQSGSVLARTARETNVGYPYRVSMYVRGGAVMSLQRFCKRPIVTVAPEKMIPTACQMLEEHNIGCLLVEERGKLCGILTDRDIALRVTGRSRDPEQTTVRQVMSGNVVAIPVDSTVHELTALMHTHHVRRVPIVDATGRAIGIVTLDDLLALLGDEMSDMGKAISDAFFRKPREAAVEAEEFHWWVMP